MQILPKLTAIAGSAALCLLSGGVLAACGTGGEAATAGSSATATVTITDAQQREVIMPVDPEVVVATDWSVVRTLTDLGVEVDAVPNPNGSLPADLAKYADERYAKVGSLFELDYEAINALEPDAVFVGSRSGSPETVAELTKITPAVADMSVRAADPADLIPLVTERTRQLGQVFGREADAAAKITELDASIVGLRAKAAAGGQTAMFVQVSGGKASAYGPGSRFGVVYDTFGFQPTEAPVNDEGSHGQEVSQEFFARYNPGVVFVLDRGKTVGDSGTPALEVLDNNLVNDTDAARNDRLAEVEGFSWYLAPNSPRSIAQMVTDVSQAV